MPMRAHFNHPQRPRAYPFPPLSLFNAQPGASRHETSQRPRAPTSITHNNTVRTHSLPSPFLIMHSQVQVGTKRLNAHARLRQSPTTTPCVPPMTTPCTPPSLPLPTPHGAMSPMATWPPDDDGHHRHPSRHTSKLNEVVCSPHAASFLYFLFVLTKTLE